MPLGHQLEAVREMMATNGFEELQTLCADVPNQHLLAAVERDEVATRLDLDVHRLMEEIRALQGPRR